MAEPSGPEPATGPLEAALAWVLGTFHAAALVVAAALALHLGGGLGATLAGLSTAPGAGAYLALWLGLWLVARRVTAGTPWTPHGPERPHRLVDRALITGGLLGGGLFVAGFLVAALPFAAAQGVGSLVGAVLVAAIGGGVAFLLGALLAGVLSALDFAALAAARRLLR